MNGALNALKIPTQKPKKTIKEYRDNCPQTSFRIKHHVEKNPNFVLTLGALKKGDWFTLKPIAEPKDSQVYEKGEYDRSEKKYSCGRRDDISYERMLKKTLRFSLISHIKKIKKERK